jgi:RNA polymerase sigma-70 factor (ECF subfamily)
MTIAIESSTINTDSSLNGEQLTKIFDMYSSAIYRYTLRLCSDPLESDNIVGDVFAQLLEQFSIGKGPTTNLRSYLYQTAYHLIIDRNRDNRKSAPLEAAVNLPEKDVNPELEVSQKQLIHSLRLAMKDVLTEDQRHVIVLHYLEGLKAREIAEIIGKEESNIKVILNRARAALRRSLFGNEQEKGNR